MSEISVNIPLSLFGNNVSPDGIIATIQEIDSIRQQIQRAEMFAGQCLSELDNVSNQIDRIVNEDTGTYNKAVMMRDLQRNIKETYARLRGISR
jgi:hypothetical protein